MPHATRYDVSISCNSITIVLLGCLGVLTILTLTFIPVYAEPVVKPTSAGTLNVSFSTEPVTPNSGDQIDIKLNFLNKQNTLQQHIDYKISVMQGGNQVFGIPVTHTAEGAVTIPFQAQTAGTYAITVEIQGILFQPIPPETADFTLDVGNGSMPVVPEFGSLLGIVTIISIVGVVLLSKKNYSPI